MDELIEAMARAIATAQAPSDEGALPSIGELLSDQYSGENNCHLTLLAAARAALAAINASGTHRVVPVVATEGMCEAAKWITIDPCIDGGPSSISHGEAASVWAAMAAAAGEE